MTDAEYQHMQDVLLSYVNDMNRSPEARAEAQRDLERLRRAWRYTGVAFTLVDG